MDCDVGCAGPYEYKDGHDVWVKCSDPHSWWFCQYTGNPDVECTYEEWLVCSPTVDLYNGSRCRHADLFEEDSTWLNCACFDCCHVGGL